MNYIRSYQSFKNQKVDEGIIGNAISGLFNGLKKKLSIGFSKMFGSAKKCDKLCQQYLQEVSKAKQHEMQYLKEYVDYEAGIENGGEKNDNEKKRLIGLYTKSKALFEKQKDIIKQKYDLKFKEIVDEEKDKRVQNYINLKKLELQQQIIEDELEMIKKEFGDKKINSVELNKILNELTQSIKNSQTEIAKESAILKSKPGSTDNTTEDKFNFEKAKTDNNYYWSTSKYAKGVYKFVEGEEVTFWSKKDFGKDQENYVGSKAYIGSDAKQEEIKKDPANRNNIFISKDPKDLNKGFIISKGRIITTKKEKVVETKPENKEKVVDPEKTPEEKPVEAQLPENKPAPEKEAL